MDLNDLPANWLKREELVLLDPQLLTDKEAPDRDPDGERSALTRVVVYLLLCHS